MCQQKTFGQSIRPFFEKSSKKKSSRLVIISGFPYDEGTKRNYGRIGGAVASSIFRQTLLAQELYPKTALSVFDAGDIEPDKQLQIAHEDYYLKNKKLLQQIEPGNGLIFCIGGSNDQSYPNVRAMMSRFPNSKIGVINIDAHLDVRAFKENKVHSGSPFRCMLQDADFYERKSKFIEFGIKGTSCSKADYEYAKSKQVDVYWMQKDIRQYKLQNGSKYRTQAGQLFEKILYKLALQTQHIFVSFDTDSINSKWMPGVSAPNVGSGLTNEQAIQLMAVTGSCSQVCLVDMSQFNPAVQSLMSSRMIVEMFYRLCECFHQRQSAQ